jgi:hypothetical protein
MPARTATLATPPDTASRLEFSQQHEHLIAVPVRLLNEF